MQLITQVWSTELERYVEDEISLWDALPSWQQEALCLLLTAFPGSEVLDDQESDTRASSAA